MDEEILGLSPYHKCQRQGSRSLIITADGLLEE